MVVDSGLVNPCGIFCVGAVSCRKIRKRQYEIPGYKMGRENHRFWARATFFTQNVPRTKWVRNKSSERIFAQNSFELKWAKNLRQGKSFRDRESLLQACGFRLTQGV
jgi:hypothetical protein